MKNSRIYMQGISRVSVIPLLIFSFGLFFATSAFALESAGISAPQVAPAPITELRAHDTDNDHGHSITLNWTLSGDDGAGAKSVISYQIMRASTPEGPFANVGLVPAGATSFENSSSIDSGGSGFISDNSAYYYRVNALTSDSTVFSSSETVGPVHSYGQWFNKGLFPVLYAVIIFTALTLIYVFAAKKGKELYVRPLAGIEAVDDAIGRATEMGKPILYVFGLGTPSDIATIASFTILSRVAKRVAEYQTSLIVPCYDPIVMAVAQDIVKTSYSDAGRPDDYKEDSVFFITQAQFAYVGAVNGIMLRELPATNLYLGKFYAESLMLAETGVVSGSIQIAGTDEIAQIPFFVVACDYTLIGEELFAASAYLGREPLLLGSLKAQDYAKAAVLILALLGLLTVNFAADLHLGWLVHFKDWFKVID